MVFVGFAAALMVRVSDGEDLRAFTARTNSTKVAYQNCLLSRAAQAPPGRKDDQIAQDILASCKDKLDAWMNAMAKGATPEAKAHAMTLIQPLLPNLARLVITTQRARQAARPPADSGPVTRHAPEERASAAAEDDRAASPAARSTPAGPCGGIATPADPGALTCRN